MNKILITALLSASITAGAQTLPVTPTKTSPAVTTETRGPSISNKTVQLRVAGEGASLRASLEALARAGGYRIQLKPGTVLTGTVDINADGPFDLIWTRVTAELDLRWQIEGNLIIIDGTPETRVITLTGLSAEDALKTLTATSAVKAASSGQTIVISGTPSAVNAAAQLLNNLDAARSAELSAAQAAQKQAAELSAAQTAQEEARRAATAPAPAAEQQLSYQAQHLSSEQVSAILKEFNVRSVTIGNRYLLSGTEVNVTAAAKQLTAFDQPAPAPSTTRVKLKYLSSKDAQTLLSIRAPGITVQPEPRSGYLSLSGTATQLSAAQSALAEADLPDARIEVQVRIQEISDRAQQALGLNLNGSIGGFQLLSGQAGLQAAFDPTKIGLGFNLLPSLDALEAQGLTKRVYQGQVTLKPPVDGEAPTGNNARIQTGGVLELNLPGNGGSEGIKKTLPYGLTLEFSEAALTPGELISLKVRSAITGAPASLDNPQLLSFTNSEAQASVTLRSGETSMLAGLLSTERQKDNSGAPVLSKIPGIGALFGKQSDTVRQTQLLIIIQAQVVR